VPRPYDPRVGDEQRAMETEVTRERSEPLEAALAENDTRPELKIERDHVQ
jgi:hypothetical protein